MTHEFTNFADQACENAADSVAYIYGELDRSSRVRFEAHLAGCDTCVEELAGVSLSRLSVYEWNRDVFAKLETPEITIPYPAERPQDVSETGVSYFDRIAAFLFRPAFAGGFAALIVAVIAGIALFSTETENDSLAKIDEPTRIVTTPAQPVVSAPDLVESTSDEVAATKASIEHSPTRRPRTIATTRATAVKASATVRNSTVAGDRDLTLSEYRDIDDDSLRLSQMLDELGG